MAELSVLCHREGIRFEGSSGSGGSGSAVSVSSWEQRACAWTRRGGMLKDSQMQEAKVVSSGR